MSARGRRAKLARSRHSSILWGTRARARMCARVLPPALMPSFGSSACTNHLGDLDHLGICYDGCQCGPLNPRHLLTADEGRRVERRTGKERGRGGEAGTGQGQRCTASRMSMTQSASACLAAHSRLLWHNDARGKAADGDLARGGGRGGGARGGGEDTGGAEHGEAGGVVDVLVEKQGWGERSGRL